MSITKATVESMFTAARSAFSGASVVIRHGGREYTGTRLPTDKAEMVDESGAMFTVTGGARFLVSEFAPVWPKAGDQINVKSPESGDWLTFVVVSTRLDEMQATILLTYGERYDEYGAL